MIMLISSQFLHAIFDSYSALRATGVLCKRVYSKKIKLTYQNNVIHPNYASFWLKLSAGAVPLFSAVASPIAVRRVKRGLTR